MTNNTIIAEQGGPTSQSATSRRASTGEGKSILHDWTVLIIFNILALCIATILQVSPLIYEAQAARVALHYFTIRTI